jgi:hypothetical protein
MELLSLLLSKMGVILNMVSVLPRSPWILFIVLCICFQLLCILLPMVLKRIVVYFSAELTRSMGISFGRPRALTSRLKYSFFFYLLISKPSNILFQICLPLVIYCWDLMVGHFTYPHTICFHIFFLVININD